MNKAADHVKELVIVRHGETPYNTADRAGRFLTSSLARIHAGGLPDHLVPLSDKGRDQAAEVGRRLATMEQFDVYFDSGYERSVETLNIILQALPASERAPAKRRSHLDLREREPGYTFNMTVTEVNRYFPWYQEYEATFGKFYSKPPGGESIAHVCSRVHMFLNSLRRARTGKRVLVVTHGRVMLCFRFWIERILPSKAESLFAGGDIKNCGVLWYVWNGEEGRFQAKSFDDAA